MTPTDWLMSECKRGHVDPPRYKGGQCKLCAVITRKAWYVANKDHHKELRQQWLSTNRGRHRELTRTWYQENRTKHLASTAEWAANNLPLKAHYRRVRRAKAANAPGSATSEQVTARMAYFGNCCRYCGGEFEEVDHAIPLSRGGTAWPANLGPSCVPCNRSKGNKTVLEFVA